MIADHGNDAGDMEAADRDRDASLSERTRQVKRAWELVGLNAHQGDQAETAMGAELLQQHPSAEAPADLGCEALEEIDVVSMFR